MSSSNSIKYRLYVDKCSLINCQYGGKCEIKNGKQHVIAPITTQATTVKNVSKPFLDKLI